jgi:hypothetical protein
MREDLCSIPVHDVFLPKCGCPFCTMRDMLEDRIATYITGAAMMEPNVRVETNHLGFCHEHFDQIIARGSKLSIALILESLLDEIHHDIFPQEKTPAKKVIAAFKERQNSCFICENVEKNMVHLIKSTLHLWQSDSDFRTLYADQPYICFSHYGMVIEAAQKMPKKNFPIFAAETTRLSENYLKILKTDVTHFCRMFDYRNKDADWGNSKTATDRAVEYLVSRKANVSSKTEEKNR